MCGVDASREARRQYLDADPGGIFWVLMAIGMEWLQGLLCFPCITC
jgi:hypothetical protein